MIIKLLLQLVYQIFNVLTLPINIPDLPVEINNVITTIIQYVGTGLAILENYTHLSYLLILFGVVVAIDVGLWLYKLIMFFIRKIPMLNVR